MANVLTMPRLSDTMTEGVLVNWVKKEGDAVEAGDVVAEVETDKATMELECFDSGILAKILAPAGKGVVVGGPIAIIADDANEDLAPVLAKLGQGAAPAAPAAAPAKAPAAPAAAPAAPVAAPATAPAAVAAAPAAAPAPKVVSEDGRTKASPLARKMASENHLTLDAISGSGPGGRIVKKDIEKALEEESTRPAVAAAAATPAVTAPKAASPAPALDASADSELVPLSQMRKAIARRMVEAKDGVPHFYLTAEVDMGPAMALRQQLNDAAAGSVKISVNDLILKACAVALVKHPRVNASFAGDSLAVHSSVHLGFAAAVEDGLMTPTIRNCHQKSIGQIAKEARDLAEKALNKKLKPEDFSGATFTVSNLGMYGIVEFVAIINPPQAAILAVGAVREIPVVEKGQLAVGKRMRITLSCDHRVIDGALGAQFLATLREVLETPMRLVL